METRKMLLCLAVLGWTLAVPATDRSADAQTLDAGEVAAKTVGAGARQETEADRAFPKFEEVTKDMKAHEGLFTLWCYPEGAGDDKDFEKLLCQIPKSVLGKKFMLSTSFSGGGFFTGFPVDEHVVRWEELGRQLLLIEPETRFVVNEDSTVDDVVRRTYPDRIRTAVSIVTKSPGGDPVIDLGPLLKSDFANIGWMTFGGGGINEALSKWTKKKPFPHNVEIGVELAVGRTYPPGSYDKKLLHYSFWALRETGYQPRVADDRVGYFLTTNRDWSKPTAARDIFNRYIDRWPLEKRDPSLDLCEPKQPIVFYIEKTVPVRFRRAARDGILEWNKAFETIGFVNAIEVRQQTRDNEYKDLDPEDMRYSFFRWIVAGAGFAMGPHRANPFTGEIYDADIIFDDAMVRYFEQEAERMLPTAAMQMRMRDPTLRAFFAGHPQWKRPVCAWESFAFGEDNPEDQREAMRQHLWDRGHHCCEYAEGMKHQMAFAGAVLANAPREVTERFLYEVIKQVVTHEVGHTLGLRHNFKASSIYTLDEVRRRRTTGEPTCGSIMDYNPVLFFVDKPTEGHFITPTIGPYDYWAIEYGYRPYDGKYPAPSQDKPEKGEEEGAKASEAETEAAADIAPAAPLSGEEAMLRAIASRAAEPELAYATDEDSFFVAPDPRADRFDMGADPIDWAQTRIDLVNHRMQDILQWAVKDEESWYHLRSTFLNLLIEKAFVLDYVGRYIGGQYFSRAHRGDPDAPPPFVLVETAVQRRALDFIEQNLFRDEFFTFSPEVLNHLAPTRWWHEGTRINFVMDFPIHSFIGLLQWWNLFDRLMPVTLQRIHDAELKTSESDKFTAAEYLGRLHKACWADACDVERARNGQWTDAQPFLSSIRRSLQREYLGLLEVHARIAPGVAISPDLHAMIIRQMETLRNDIDRVLQTGKLDFASEAHLGTSRSRIQRILESEIPEYGRF
jgi:hypothetical protein